MTTQLKNIKMFRGREGYGLNATLYVDGVRTAFVMDDGNGGCYNYEVYDKPRFEAFQERLKTVPPQMVDGDEMELDADLYICLLHMAQEEKKEFNLLGA